MKLFTIRVRGPFALFCPAWLRAEPYSEPGPTPAALSGIYRAIYRKPQFEWCISRYRWAKPIRYETLKRSGVDRGAFTSEYGHRAHGLRGAVDPFALRNSWPKGYPAPDAARVKTLLGQGASALATEIARTKTRDVRVLAGQSAVCLAVAAYYGWRGLPIGSLPAILAPGSPAIFVTQPVRT